VKRTRLRTVTAALGLALLGAPVVAAPHDASPQSPKTTFRSTVDVVSVAAVVRDKRGRFATGLKKEDFFVEEGGSRRDILQFHADSNAPVRVALLFDVSGSMRLGDRVEEARQAARHVLGALRMGQRGGAFGAPAEPNAGGIRQLNNDEAAVFSFDMNLQSLQPFTVDAGAIESALARVTPYGQTSLYDAIAQTARGVADTGPGDPHRRAVVVFTDGIDTSSQLTAGQVSTIASEIDVPVYVMTVVSPSEYEDLTVRGAAPESALRTLAQWTGGDLFVTSAPAHKSVAARQIVDELRHQYVLAFTASTAAGWRPLTVKTRDRDLTVRARRGYAAGKRAGS
jgi:Mg-chelatase subunit ChlD